ncbi:MAG: T9SS type A sorting domain-containing protein [Bacteroidales bacterium]
MAGFLSVVFTSEGQPGTLVSPSEQMEARKDVTATIIGNASVCEGDSSLAYIYMTGTSPWDVEVSNSDSVYTRLEGITSPYALWLKPSKQEVFEVTGVVDGDGDRGSTFGQAVVTMDYPTPVNIILDRVTYLSSEAGVELHADHEPGIFSGPGVSGGFFYPSIATPVGSPHTVTYVYSNQYGCKSGDDIQISVLEGTGSVVLLSGGDTISVLCEDEGIYEIVGSNKVGIPGEFELRITNSNTLVPGHIIDSDLTDNKALLDPTGLKGGYDIVYQYTIDGVVLKASTLVRVDIIGTLEISSTLPSKVCKSDDPYLLKGNMDGVDPLATWSFSGPGVTGSMSNGFYYNPADPSVEVGTVEIFYTYSTESGCTASTSRKVRNLFVPDVYFVVNTVCLPGEGGEIAFDNRTTGKYSVETWSWNFGDYSSGSANYSNEENPVHFYKTPGQRQINLTATTLDGCVTYYELDTLLADKPTVDFTMLSDCYVRGDQTIFINRSESTFAPMDTLVWSFRTGSGSVLGALGKSPGDDTIQFPFSAIDTYEVELYVSNTGGCSNSLSREITLKSTVQLSPSGKLERFNQSQGGWSIQSEDGNESWVWGVPDFTGFEPIPGDMSWYTDLPYRVTGYNEHSWVESSCYDLSQMRRPLIQLDIMKSFVPNLTGAVLQYQDVIEEGWKTIGTLEEGVNWYNSGSIFYQPGGSDFGWGLNTFLPDRDWVTALSDLQTVAGKSQVKFRIAIATNGGQSIGNQGFAFDNIFFTERNKKSLLEHFTNSGDLASQFADEYVDDYYLNNSMNVIDLQYHTSYPGNDPMNQNNPESASTREGVLGIGQVPYAVLDGGINPAYRYNFSSADQSPGSEELELLSLEIPKFNISIDTDWLDDKFTAKVNVACNTDTFTNNLQLYVAVIESDVTAYTGDNGDTHFRNVVLDMLPTPAGKLLGNEWGRGKTETLNYTWDYLPYVEDIEDLGVIVFVQDRETHQVLQSASSHLDSQVGFKEDRAHAVTLSVYPNPASQFVNVNLGERATREGRLEITDLSGRVVMKSEVLPGYAINQLQVSSLPQGIYVICWIEEGKLKGRNKIILTR